MFRTSFKFDEDDNAPYGVIEPIVLQETDSPDLLKVEGVDEEKIEQTGDCWIVRDLEYFDELESHLDNLEKLHSVSPYSDFLKEPIPFFPQVEKDALIDWENIPATPFDYQKEAIETAILDHDGRSIIALKTGAGKTMIGAIFMYYCLYRQDIPGEALVICPASKTLDWLNDYVKWTGRTTQNVRAMTFEMASRRAEDNISMFNKFKVIVVDECHHLKNKDTLVSERLTPILHKVPFVMLLSGTPQMNRNSELFNQFHIVRPDVFDDHRVFTERFSGGHINRSGVWDARGSDFLWELNYLAKRVMYKRDVVVTTMKKIRHRIYTVPTRDQILEQDKLTNRRNHLSWKISQSTNQGERRKLELARNALITKMHRCAGKWKSTNAIQTMRDIIDKHPGKKIAFFADQIAVIKAFKSAIDKFGLGESAILTGKSSKKDRQVVVDRMSNENNPLRFGFFTPCMREGVTMSPGTSVIVLLEIGWSPSEMDQKENRVYRVGTAETVNIYWIFCLNSYDDEAYEKIVAKASEIESVLGNKLSFDFDTEIKPEMPYVEKPKRRKKRAKIEQEKEPLLVEIGIEI